MFVEKCLHQSFPASPLLLIVINTDTAWTKGDNQQQSTNNRSGLEEIILEEISQWRLRVVHPPWIHIYIYNGEQKN